MATIRRQFYYSYITTRQLIYLKQSPEESLLIDEPVVRRKPHNTYNKIQYITVNDLNKHFIL